MMALFPWLMEPDWTGGVTETLEWKTDVLQSPTGAEQRISRRLSPRRMFEFGILAGDVDRQWLENAVWQAGGSEWAMPVFPDVTSLQLSVTAGATQLRVDTTGRDFSVGGTVLLKNAESMSSPAALVTISGIAPDSLTLSQPLAAGWLAGTAVYPVRPAVLTDPPAFPRITGALASAQVRFRIAEHNAFSATTGPALYRGHPVLETEADWSESLTGEYQRLLIELDNGSGVPARLDTARRPFYLQRHTWSLMGRSEQFALRQLMYHLRGRQRALWVPSQNDDFTPAGDLTGNTLSVIRCGFSEMGVVPGRRDLRILLADGRSIYRRVTGAAINGATELLALDGESVSVPLRQIVSVSFMTFARQNNDAITWQHTTDADGFASVATSFIGVRDELE
ncbi:hypothetical protein [Serratia ficaria]|uniref:hypothetical protein n=2 Tax=Serratia ficaria TaxID=61651 RepID=UPI0021C5D543|nr:hypothetical protein [Serratia ficaria]